MKTITYIIFSTLLFCSTASKAQCQVKIDTTSYSYYNGITSQSQTIDHYQITNNSNEDYLTWVALEPINNRINIEVMHDFFKKRNGDFTYMEMMYENLLDAMPISIGNSFIKNIKAGTTFSYFIAKPDTTLNIYQGRIVLIKKIEVDDYLKMPIEEKFYYKLPSIFLTQK